MTGTVPRRAAPKLHGESRPQRLRKPQRTGRTDDFGAAARKGKLKTGLTKTTFVKAAEKLARRVPAGEEPPQPGLLARGETLIPDKVDGRSLRARRFRESYHAIIRDLGGKSYISHAQHCLAQRAAWASVMAEELQTLWMLEDERFDPEQLNQLIRIEIVLYRTLGLKRIAKPLPSHDPRPKDLKSYLELTAQPNGAAA